jgi:hypothetical protein
MTASSTAGGPGNPLKRARVKMIFSIILTIFLILVGIGMYVWGKYHSSADQYGDPSMIGGPGGFPLSVALGFLILFDVGLTFAGFCLIEMTASAYFRERSHEQ